MGPRNHVLDGVQFPTYKGKGQFFRVKGSQSRTFPDMCGGRYTQSDSAGGRTGTVQLTVGGVVHGVHIGAKRGVRKFQFSTGISLYFRSNTEYSLSLVARVSNSTAVGLVSLSKFFLELLCVQPRITKAKLCDFCSKFFYSQMTFLSPNHQ